MESISHYLHLIESRDKQNVSQTPVVNQDPLKVKITDCDRDNQCIIMGEMQASQILVSEGDGLVGSNHK